MSDKVMVEKAELERLQAAARDAVTRWHIDRKWEMARGKEEYPEAEWVTELREAAALAPAPAAASSGKEAGVEGAGILEQLGLKPIDLTPPAPPYCRYCDADWEEGEFPPDPSKECPACIKAGRVPAPAGAE